MTKLSESNIQNMILDYLNQKGIFSFRVNTTGTYDSQRGVYRSLGKFQLKGTSDIIGCLPDGKMLAIEVKSETGRLSPEQKAFIDKIKKQGGIAFVAKNLQDVERELQDYKIFCNISSSKQTKDEENENPNRHEKI